MASDDTLQLVEDEGELGVAYRAIRCCCDSRRRRTTTVVILLLCVAAITMFILSYFLVMRPKTRETASSHNSSPAKISKPACCPNISRQGNIQQSSISPGNISHGNISHGNISHGNISHGNISHDNISHGSISQANICETALCHDISQAISKQLDKSVDPCDDFYSYACGGFFKDHKLDVNQSKIDAFTLLNDENMNVLRHALENVTSYSQSSSILKTGKIYNSCVNTSAIDKRGAAPLLKLIEQYGGWSVTGIGITNSWTLEERMGHILRDLNVQTLLSISVITDFMDSTSYVLNIGASSLGMSADYYTSFDANAVKIRTAYKNYMKAIARLLGGDGNADSKMMRIYDFEEKLAKARLNHFYSEDLVETMLQYHRSGRSLDPLHSTIADFCEDSSFSEGFMLNFLNAAFSDQGLSFDSHEKVFYVQDKYGSAPIYEKIQHAYLESSQRTVEDYIMWRVVDQFVLAMPQQYVDAKLNYLTAVIGPRESERWSHCLEEMMTPMDMTLGRLFVDADFNDNIKNTVEDMTTRVRTALTDRIKSSTWMDWYTREKAKEKVDAMAEDVGYPPYIKDDSELDSHYAMLRVGDDFFENMKAVKKMEIQRQFGRLRLPVNKDLWSMSPANINAYYSATQNRIVILAGIVHSPFYKKYWPKYFNYASLAMIIGHEMTHGFDNSGRIFDKDGNYRDWWSKSSELAFEQRARCLVTQYGDYTVFGEKINGLQTLNENIADNGGIKLAYDAYQSWVDHNKKEEQLPDLGLSVDQLFFIGFAMPWCGVYSREEALYQLKNSVHSYHRYRVIGSLSNFERFSKAFSCSRGSKMNPERKCAVW